MNAKKALKIICIVGAGLCVIVFAYLWSLGVFSGSSTFVERNPVVEEAIEKTLNERVKEVFEKEGLFTDERVEFVSVDTQVAVEAENFPLDKYAKAEDVTEEVINKAIEEYPYGITFEVKLRGGRLEFNEYKVVAYQCENALYEGLKLQPLSMQLFYYRAPEDKETEDVMAYESQIPGYYFGNDQKNVVNASGVHYIVELDEKLETKAKWFYGYKLFYIIFLGVVVVALTVLLIVRTVKKKRRYRNSRHIDEL